VLVVVAGLVIIYIIDLVRHDLRDRILLMINSQLCEVDKTY